MAAVVPSRLSVVPIVTKVKTMMYSVIATPPSSVWKRRSQAPGPVLGVGESMVTSWGAGLERA